MTDEGATPRPWAVAVDEGLHCVIEHRHGTDACLYDTPSDSATWSVTGITAEDGDVVCLGHDYDESGSVSMADAALIVAAVNDYDRLRAIEEAARAVLVADSSAENGDDGADRAWDASLDALRDALSGSVLLTKEEG